MENILNPEALAIFGLFATVICFGFEQLGIGVKGADTAKLQRALGLIAILFGGAAQLFGSLWMFFMQQGNQLVATVFGFFGFFWTLVGVFFLKGGDKKVMAHFFGACLVMTILFTIEALSLGLVWPLAIDLIVIDILLLCLTISWYNGNVLLTRIAGACNVIIGIISFFLLHPNVVS